MALLRDPFSASPSQLLTCMSWRVAGLKGKSESRMETNEPTI
jgi:hypothetical protein